MEIRIIDSSNDPRIVAGIVKIYRAAFGGKPWNEGWKCSRHPQCSFTAPLKTIKSECPACGSKLKAFWPHKRVRGDFRREMRKPNARCFLANEKKKIIGFAWGYALTITTESIGWAARYLDAPQLDESQWGLGQTFWYLDEVAVSPKQQKKGIGRQIVEAVRLDSQCDILLRTLKDSQMHHLVESLGGQTIFEISEGRVIMLIPRP